MPEDFCKHMRTDLELKRQVISRLELEPKIDVAALDVTVHDGVVTLRGTVDNEAERTCTERVLKLMNGVRGLVDDDLRVKAAARLRRSDFDLQTEAYEVIKWLTTVPEENVEVTVRNGWIQISGEAESAHQAQCLEALLREIPGVRGVKSLLKVSRGCRAA